MVKVDLITGFLGAGKTTFLQKYYQYLKRQGESLYLIENEFGPVGVDAAFLKKEIDVIRDLSGKCMCCKGYEEFRMLLIDAAMQQYSRILVEPSGIYDVDEFFHIMDDPAVKKYCEIGSIITIVDPMICQTQSKNTDYLMMCQVLASGGIVLSKTQECTEEVREDTVERLKTLLQLYDAQRELHEAEVFRKNWSEWTDTDFERITSCGYHHSDHRKESLMHELIYSSTFFPVLLKDRETILSYIRELFQDSSFGHVLRVKGYARIQDGTWYEINCTETSFSITEARVKRGLMVVIGEDLDEKRIQERSQV